MEDNNNTVNFDAVLSEMSALNKGISSSNEKLDELILFLQNSEKRQLEKEQQDELKKVQEAQEQGQRELEQEQLESEADQAEQETYTEILSDIRTEIQFNNQLIAGSFLFYGIICGILLFKILWDKLT